MARVLLSTYLLCFLVLLFCSTGVYSVTYVPLYANYSFTETYTTTNNDTIVVASTVSNNNAVGTSSAQAGGYVCSLVPIAACGKPTTLGTFRAQHNDTSSIPGTRTIGAAPGASTFIGNFVW